MGDRIDADPPGHVVVLKPAFLGGVVATRDLIKAASAEGLHCIVTHALESAVGRAAAIHLACALPDAPVCGLASALAIEALTPALLEINRRYKTHAGIRITDL